MTFQSNIGRRGCKSVEVHVANYLYEYARVHVAAIEDAEKCSACGGTGLDKDRVGSFCLNVRWYWCPRCQGGGRKLLKGTLRIGRIWPRVLTAEEIRTLHMDPKAEIS